MPKDDDLKDLEPKHIDFEAVKEEGDASIFLGYFDRAKTSGVEREFVIYFLRNFRQTGCVDEACWYAAYEWDI